MVYSILLLIALGVVTAFFIIRYRDNKPIIKIIKVEPKLPPHLAAMKKIETIKADKVAKRKSESLLYGADRCHPYIYKGAFRIQCHGNDVCRNYRASVGGEGQGIYP